MVRGLGSSIAASQVACSVMTDLADRLGIPLPAAAHLGADLVARRRQGLPLPPRGVLLRTVDGWVHPGPPEAWPAFSRMAEALGAAPPGEGGRPFPDLTPLRASDVDSEAGAWHLPAVEVRSPPVSDPTDAVPETEAPASLAGAVVVVWGAVWATPLAGSVLSRLGARVVRVHHPGRPDRFPLAAELGQGAEHVSVDLREAPDREVLVDLLRSADLLLDGNTPRVLPNLGFDAEALAAVNRDLALIAVTALSDDDRPGYGMAAECRAGWAARHEPPRLGRSSVADPVAGLLAALRAAAVLTGGERGSRHRVGLDTAVRRLLAAEGAGGP